MNDIVQDLNWRYAVKKFDAERLLSNEQLDRLKEIFKLTATSYGLQPVRLLVLQNKKLQQELVAHSYEQQQVAQASHVLVFCIEKEVNASYISNYFELVKKARGTSNEILNPFKEMMIETFSNKNANEIQAWSKNQAYLILGTLLTACAIEKIDACPMEGFDPAAYDELLGLSEKGISSVLVMPIGYRAKDDVFSTFKKVRKEVGKSVIEIL